MQSLTNLCQLVWQLVCSVGRVQHACMSCSALQQLCQSSIMCPSAQRLRRRCGQQQQRPVRAFVSSICGGRAALMGDCNRGQRRVPAGIRTRWPLCLRVAGPRVMGIAARPARRPPQHTHLLRFAAHVPAGAACTYVITSAPCFVIRLLGCTSVRPVPWWLVQCIHHLAMDNVTHCWHCLRCARPS